MKVFDFGYKTLSEVAARVTEGAVQGFEGHTSEYLAASYALGAASEQGGDFGIEDIEAHLEVLYGAGARFETLEAVKVAEGIKKQ